MKILGIRFAPLNVPLQRRLQILAIGFYLSLISLVWTSWLIILYLILYTKFWFLPILYLIWIWVFDKEVCEKGGRRIEWVRRWKIWSYAKEYFPVNFMKDSNEIELDPKRNYLFCTFPHGTLVFGASVGFGTSCGGFHELFPKHTPHILSLKGNYFVPFLRDFSLAMGGCAVSAKSINFLMSKQEGGNAALLVVGGIKEQKYCKPGDYHIVVRNRKGFVKLALKNGCPLVPVFSFGEIDLYDELNSRDGLLIKMFNKLAKKIIGRVPFIPIGRGYYQYSFGLLPHRRPINVIVGKPIDVEKIEDPTEDQIDALHATFVKQLTELFEKHKQKYVEKSDETILVIH